jgi:hypothetical protein
MTVSEPKNRRRSQRITLQTVVLINATLIDGKTVRVQAFTLVVSAHGGLLESPLKLAVNQRILLINPHSGKDVGCRVVRVEESSSASYEVAFEFECHSPQFWPLTFPPEDWAMAKDVENHSH